MYVSRSIQTQEMVRKAKEDFPNLQQSDAIQREADMGPGREAAPGEGQPGSLGSSVKNTVQGVLEAVKQANPATRDTREKQ